MESKITIEKVSYSRTKDVRILKSCLETWFQNPKDLNLVDPSMNYPFNLNKWITKYYNRGTTRTFVLKMNDWIIGYMSLQLQSRNEFVHLFHVFIDRENRGKGLGKLLVNKAISYAKKGDIPVITLFVKPNNDTAIKLYNSFGFKNTGEFSSSGSPKMMLRL